MPLQAKAYSKSKTLALHNEGICINHKNAQCLIWAKDIIEKATNHTLSRFAPFFFLKFV